MEKSYDIITILGHTAAGKTAVAAGVAAQLDGEVISADSRQVYRQMDLGTGKDYADYHVGDINVPVHLVDIHDAGYQYNLYEFLSGFRQVFDDISARGRLPVLCGGTGLYIEAVLKDYRLVNVPVDEALRQELADRSMKELQDMLSGMKALHNTTDTVNRKRMIRALEIARYEQEHQFEQQGRPELRSLTVGISFERELRRQRITKRLEQRLSEGMVEEVKRLLDSGLSPGQLDYYGLEYRFLTRYVTGKISYDEMFASLNTAIHRFAKRQMTYFRGMERKGIAVRWLDGAMGKDEMIGRIREWFNEAPR